MTNVATCLWFDGNGEEAARFYTSLISNSSVAAVFRPDPQKPALMVHFTLDGVPFQILNGGPQHPPTEFASISVLTPDQAETDRLWTALTADGGKEVCCGWLKDRFGVSWQIVPEALPRLLCADKTGRVMKAMMGMIKIDVAGLEAAARG